MAELGLGIDIGATKIVVAVCRNDKAEIILNQEGCRSTKFCIAFNNKERLFGVAAEGQYPVNPENTIHGRDVKKIIGLRKDDLKMPPIAFPLKLEGSYDNIKFSVDYKNRKQSLFPEHILAMVLRKVKNELEDAQQPKAIHAVITVPSMFNSAQRFAIRNAVLASGIEVDSIINDSTATAITYSIDRHGSGDKNILVFDMGASSLDLAVVSLTGNTVGVKACGGSLDIGGDMFDLLLLQHFIRKFEEEKYVRISDDKQIVARLRVACEKFKKMLSATGEANYIIDSFYRGEQYQLKMNRNKFESLCTETFEKVRQCVNDVCNSAQVIVDEVVVVGNGGRIPIIEQMLSDWKGISKVLNYDESVAIGAAYHAARNVSQSYRIKNLNVVEVLAMPIKIKLGCYGFLTAIKKGKILPYQNESIYEFNYPTVLSFEQENFILTAHSSIKVFCEIFSCVDENGLVKIFVKEDSEQTVSLLNHQKTTHPKIKQIDAEEAGFEKDEKQYKKAMELKNELEKHCLGYKRKIRSKDLQEFLNEDEKAQFLELCQETLDWLDDCDQPEIDILTSTMENVKEKCELYITKAKYRGELQHADLLFSEKNYQNANAVYKHIMENFGQYLNEEEHIYLMLQRAFALNEMKDYHNCISLLDSLIYALYHHDTKNLLKATRLRAFAHYGLKNFKKCVTDIKTVLDHAPNDLELQKLKNTAEIEQCTDYINKKFKETEQYTKNNWFARSNSVLSDLSCSNEFKTLAAKDPTLRATVYIMTAKNHFKSKDYKQAIQGCNFAEKYAESHVEIWEIRAECYLEQGMLSDAETDIQALETVEFFNKDRLNDLKRKLEGKRFKKVSLTYDKHFRDEQYQSALNALEQVNADKLQKDQKLDHFCKQAAALLKLGRFEEGANLCGKILNIDKRNGRAFELRAHCYFGMKEYQKTIDDCTMSLKFKSFSVYEINKLKKEAQEALDKNKGFFRHVVGAAGNMVVSLVSSKQNNKQQISKIEQEYMDLAQSSEDGEVDHLSECDATPGYLKPTESSKNKKVAPLNPEQEPRRSGRNKYKKKENAEPSTSDDKMEY